jgi:hypothetical protein
MAFQSNAFQSAGFQVPAAGGGPIRDNACLLEFEDASGDLILEDGLGFLALEVCVEVAPALGGAGFVHFYSRRRWRELMEALYAEEQALADIQGNRTPAQQDALRAATDAANAALLAAQQAHESAKLNADLVRLTNSLNAAVGASKVKYSIGRANAAIAASHSIIAEIRRQEEEEDEDMRAILMILQ